MQETAGLLWQAPAFEKKCGNETGAKPKTVLFRRWRREASEWYLKDNLVTSKPDLGTGRHLGNIWKAPGRHV